MNASITALLEASAVQQPEATALIAADDTLTYGRLWAAIRAGAGLLRQRGVRRGDRIAVYLDKRIETVVVLFAAMQAGAVAVALNPVLKARQVEHILHDCAVRLLITSTERLAALASIADLPETLTAEVMMAGGNDPGQTVAVIANDPAVIFYTSGSTGRPKGVVVSHGNLLAGAESVAGYLGLTAADRIFSLLPLSFDAGFSQLTTGFRVGAAIVLHTHLLAAGTLAAMVRHRITALTAVPPLWVTLTERPWPPEIAATLRILANTGGHMPGPVLQRLRSEAADARIFLMYGLTEAFRSTYLPPEELDRRPGSIGRAIPGAEILVVGEDGQICPPGVAGELVHRGPTVSLGYWNDAALTRHRFRPPPIAPGSAGLPEGERAVWSGDLVSADAEGFLTFVGRRDDMIKTSGYRVSPTEIEEIAYQSADIGEAAAVGLADDGLGQRIVLVVSAREGGVDPDIAGVADRCRAELPTYMVPARILLLPMMPHGPNGKIDRAAVREWAGQQGEG